MNDQAVNRWRRQKALFQEVLECEPARRAEVLARVREDDETLVLDVEAMLAAHDDEAFLAEPFLAPADDDRTTERLDTFLDSVLEGKYRIEKRLGRGGMGSVYRATHLGTSRPVAVKIIAPEFMANPEFVERFKREAKAAGRLRHPNVVNVTDFGFAEVGSQQAAYLVMEYLDGCTLGEMMEKQARLPFPLVVDVLEQICLAVDEAHAQGILHRDLKPANIWLEPDGRGTYTVKVLDFGLAKLRDADASDQPSGRELSGDPLPASALPGVTRPTLDLDPSSTSLAPAKYAAAAPARRDADEMPSELATGAADRHPTPGEIDPNTIAYSLTRVGAVLGTPAYMSPEQCRAEHLTGASDIYSLGVLAYEMLAGELPFSGNTMQLLVKHAEMPAPSLRVVRPDLTPELDGLVGAALAKCSSERPPTAAAFAAALRLIAQGEPTLRSRVSHLAKTTLAPLRSLFFRAQLPYLVFACLLVALLAPPWPFALPVAGLVQFLCWLAPLAAFAMAIDAVASASSLAIATMNEPGGGGPKDLRSRVERLAVGIAGTSLVANLRPQAILAASVLAVEGGGVREAVARSRHLVGPLRTFARALFFQRLLGAVATLTVAVFVYSLVSSGSGDGFGRLVGGVSALAAATAVTTFAALRNGVARAMLYAAARTYRGEAPDNGALRVATQGLQSPVRFRKRPLLALATRLVALSLVFGMMHVLFVPPVAAPFQVPRNPIAQVPAGENAWVEYHRALETAGFASTARSDQERKITSLTRDSDSNKRSLKGVSQDLMDFAEGTRPSLDDQQRALVAASAKGFEHMIAGAKRPRAQFTSEVPSYDSPIPTILGLRSLVLLAAVRARMLADEGRTGAAVELYLSAYEMGTDYSEPATAMVGSLGAASARGITASALFSWLGRGGADSATEVEMARKLAELDSRMLAPADILDVEIDVANRAFEDVLLRGKDAIDLDLAPTRLMSFTPGLRRRIYEGAIAANTARRALRPLMERWDVAALQEAASRRQGTDDAWWSWTLDPIGAIAKRVSLLSLPAEAAAARAFYADRASNAALRAMLVADAYRKQHGSYPSRLEDAFAAYGLDVPLDVATGTAVGYRLDAGAPVVWLVGYDGLDDGGQVAYTSEIPNAIMPGHDFIYRFGESLGKKIS